MANSMVWRLMRLLSLLIVPGQRLQSLEVDRDLRARRRGKQRRADRSESQQGTHQGEQVERKGFGLNRRAAFTFATGQAA